MNDCISLTELAHELGVRAISHYEQRFSGLGTMQQYGRRNGWNWVLTQAEADIIRASYAKRRRYNRWDRESHYERSKAASQKADALLGVVSSYFGIPPEELRSRSRKTAVSEARTVAYAFLESQGFSIMDIGRVLGRNHGTVLHGLNQAMCRPNARYPKPPRERAIQIQRHVNTLRARILEDPTNTPAFTIRLLTFDDLLAQATQRHPAADAIATYVRSVAFPSRPQHHSKLYPGLHAICVDAALQARIKQLFVDLERPGLAGCLQRHVETLGYRWEAVA